MEYLLKLHVERKEEMDIRLFIDNTCTHAIQITQWHTPTKYVPADFPTLQNSYSDFNQTSRAVTISSHNPLDYASIATSNYFMGVQCTWFSVFDELGKVNK